MVLLRESTHQIQYNQRELVWTKTLVFTAVNGIQNMNKIARTVDRYAR